MEIRFLGGVLAPVYHGPTGSWAVGDVRAVEEAEARRLVETMCGAFEVVDPEPAAAPTPKKRGR